MNVHEEELQKSIEAGLQPTGHDPDVQAYHEVFTRLSREPEVSLSPAFADQIVAQLLERKKHSSFRDFFWFGIGIISLVIAFVVAIVKSGLMFNMDFLFAMNLGFLKNIAGYTGLFIFGVAFITILNLLEKKFISEKGDMLSRRNDY